MYRNQSEFIAKQIEYKKHYLPYYGTVNQLQHSITDMNDFPYTGYFRGVYWDSNPIIFDREAGWSNVIPKDKKVCKGIKPVNCWQIPCSTTLPCKPTKEEDSDKLKLNESCITLYQ